MPPSDGVAGYFALSGDNRIFDLALHPDVSVNWLWYFGALAVLGLIWAAFTDLFRGRMLPDLVPLVIGIGGLAMAPFVVEHAWVNLACGGAIALIFGSGVLFGWVGLGDVKYYVAMALAGGLVGIGVILLAHVFAAVIGGITALALRNRKLAVPMAPFMVMGALTTFWLVGGPAWLILSLLGVFVLVLVAGLIERRAGTLPTPESVFAPLIAGDAARVRVRAGSRPEWRTADGEWHEAEGGRRLGAPLMDLIVHHLALTPEEEQELYGRDAAMIDRTIGGADLAIRIDAGPSHRLALRAVMADQRAQLAD